MTDEQKQYIEENIDLMEHGEWERFFYTCPIGIGGILYDAGIDFLSDMSYIPEYCFAHYIGASIQIPHSITEVSSYAFFSCTSLTSVTIPDSVTSIGKQVFYNCTSLKSVNIPNSVTSIGGSAFSWCASLTSITIPDTLTRMGVGAFSNCKNLTTIKFNGTIEQYKNIDIPVGVFDGSPISEIICIDGKVKLKI